MARGIPVVLTSRVPASGGVAPAYGFPGGGRDLAGGRRHPGRDAQRAQGPRRARAGLGAGLDRGELADLLAAQTAELMARAT